MRRADTAAICTSPRVKGPAALLVLLVLASVLPALASSEADFKRSVAELKAVEVVSGSQLRQARRAYPDRALQIPGVINGISRTGDKVTIMLQLVDGETVWIHSSGDRPELQGKARVRCLATPSNSSYSSDLDLVDVTSDQTPLDVLAGAARAALKIPPKNADEIARAAAEARRTTPVPTRGGDPYIVCKRAIAYFNPKLSPSELETITSSIITYCTEHSVDPYMVVAVIAAESRFNPNARSYKGAMGLGQLMPATAAAHGVNAYDPIANLEVAIRILRRNLDKYNGDWLKALAAYNAGTGAVSRYGGVPPYRETRDYLWRIYEYWCWLHGTKPETRPK